MSQEQLDYIVNNSEWSEEKREWNVPNFSYKQKNMGLPKLGGPPKKAMNEEEK